MFSIYNNRTIQDQFNSAVQSDKLHHANLISSGPGEDGLPLGLYLAALLLCDTNTACGTCGEDLSHARADDGPAYLTILLVGHLLGFALHITYMQFRPDPLTLALIMSLVTISASLLLLPRMKGLVVAYQWAKRMHGF